MSILLTLWLAGMPLSLAVILWALEGIPDADWRDVMSLPGIAAIAVWVVLWPFFLGLTIWDQVSDDMQER